MLSKIRHKNIVLCFGVMASPTGICLVMELGKCNLKTAIHSNMEIDPAKIVNWAMQIARGMNYLHTECVETIIHRDLKPGNVLLFDDGSLKITDFGLSKVRDRDITEKMSAVGTFEYMAPEVIQNLPYSEKADVYSFGVLVWEMLTRQIPFKGLPSLSVAFGVGSGSLCLPVPSDDCPPALTMLLSQSLERDYSRRPSFKDVLLMIEVLSRSDFTTFRADRFRSLQDLWKTEIMDVFAKFDRDARNLQERQEAISKAELTLNERERDLLEREERIRKALSSDIRCFYTKRSFEEEPIGVGVVLQRSPSTNGDHSRDHDPAAANFDLTQVSPFFISASAFFSRHRQDDDDGMASAAADRSPSSSFEFTNWFPLYICPQHGEKNRPYLKAAISAFITGAVQRPPSVTTMPPPPSEADCFTVISRGMDFVASHLSGNPNNHERLLDSYCFLHRQLLALVSWLPAMTQLSETVLGSFLAAGLAGTPLTPRELALGGRFTRAFVAIMVLPTYPWGEHVHTFVERALELLWARLYASMPRIATIDVSFCFLFLFFVLFFVFIECSPSLFPRLSLAQFSRESVVVTINQSEFMAEAFRLSRPALVSFMLMAYYVQSIGRPEGVSLQGVAQRYDGTWGRPTSQMKEEFEWTCRGILAVNSFEEFFQNVGFYHQERSSFDLLIKFHSVAEGRGYLRDMTRSSSY